jgi:thiamine kinase-like enzyme
MASMLRTLHAVELPVIVGIGDDRPDIENTISKRFCHIFDKVLEEDSFWVTLPKEAVHKLEIVRRRYHTYRDLLAEFKNMANDLNVALIHGDLAGDNVMMTLDERVVLIDWGESRISTPLADIAYLFTYSAWQPKEIQQFAHLYFGDETAKIEEALPTIQTLSKLYRFHSCVQSLLWLRESGDDGPDQIGKEHLDRQLDAL